MAMRQPAVVGVGSALVDQLCHVPFSLLEEIPGAKGGTVNLTAEELSRMLASLPPNGSCMARGGAAANTIECLARLGTRTGFLAKVGNDQAGRFFREELEKSGVCTAGLQPDERPTGRVISLITPDSDRTMRRCFDGIANLSQGDLSADDFAPYTHCLVEGYLVDEEPLVEEACRLAAEGGLEVHVDLGAPEMTAAHRDFWRCLLPRYVTTVYANDKEAAALTGEAEPHTALASLARMCPNPIVKLGADGVLLLDGGTVQHIPARQVTAVDGTGAGDSWAAGYLHGILNGWDAVASAEFGALLASEIVQVTGTQLPDEAWMRIHNHKTSLP